MEWDSASELASRGEFEPAAAEDAELADLESVPGRETGSEAGIVGEIQAQTAHRFWVFEKTRTGNRAFQNSELGFYFSGGEEVIENQR